MFASMLPPIQSCSGNVPDELPTNVLNNERAESGASVIWLTVKYSTKNSVSLKTGFEEVNALPQLISLNPIERFPPGVSITNSTHVSVHTRMNTMWGLLASILR